MPGNKFFTPFHNSISASDIPDTFELHSPPHPLAVKAAGDLQIYLNDQSDWEHNFGLIAAQTGSIIGKMFGVLVVKTRDHEVGYLAAFSGKLAGSNEHKRFVPPVFDGLSEQSFVNNGMRTLTQLNNEINELEISGTERFGEQLKKLKLSRRNYSNALQRQIFDHYFFRNEAGDTKSLNEIFKKAGYKNPPSGAGECAGPKLLQYAFQQQMKAIALTEFWWGLSPKSDQWKHGQFYTCCKEKCEPILNFMLDGRVLNKSI